jgi:hypothetical protein
MNVLIKNASNRESFPPPHCLKVSTKEENPTKLTAMAANVIR